MSRMIRVPRVGRSAGSKLWSTRRPRLNPRAPTKKPAMASPAGTRVFGQRIKPAIAASSRPTITKNQPPKLVSPSW